MQNAKCNKPFVGRGLPELSGGAHNAPADSLAGSVPNMTYNVFGGMLNLAQPNQQPSLDMWRGDPESSKEHKGKGEGKGETKDKRKGKEGDGMLQGSTPALPCPTSSPASLMCLLFSLCKVKCFHNNITLISTHLITTPTTTSVHISRASCKVLQTVDTNSISRMIN